MNLIITILDRYRANKRIWNMAFLFILASAILRWPVLISWIAQDSVKADIFNFCDLLTRQAWAFVLFFVKDAATSGNGTLANPYVKK
jgi:hypothetical protein